MFKRRAVKETVEIPENNEKYINNCKKKIILIRVYIRSGSFEIKGAISAAVVIDYDCCT